MADGRVLESVAKDEKLFNAPDDIIVGTADNVINASGHPDQLERQYGILSICGMALTVDNAWVAIGTSLNVAICEFQSQHIITRPGADVSSLDNGGPPGVLYEFLVACLYYCFIAASLAEVSLLPGPANK